MPADSYTDSELAAIIAEKLIDHGHAIDFDVTFVSQGRRSVGGD